MGTAKPNVVIVTGGSGRKPDLFGETPTKEILASTHTEELVIALCGPIGSPLHDVAKKLVEMLAQPFGYTTCNIIRLSGFIQERRKGQSRNCIEWGKATSRLNSSWQ